MVFKGRRIESFVWFAERFAERNCRLQKGLQKEK